MVSKGVIVWEWVKQLKIFTTFFLPDCQDVSFPLSKTSICSYVSAVRQVFENTVGKGEIVRNEQFSFPNRVFYALGELSAILITFKTDVCKPFLF